jgi:hypothetical protein
MSCSHSNHVRRDALLPRQICSFNPTNTVNIILEIINVQPFAVASEHSYRVEAYKIGRDQI